MNPSDFLNDLLTWLNQLWVWAQEHVLTWASLGQLIAVVVSFIAARFLSRYAGRQLDKFNEAAFMERFDRYEIWRKHVAPALNMILLPLIWLVIMWIALAAASAMDAPLKILEATVSLLIAWILIRLLSRLVLSRSLSRVVAVVVWSLAALNILGVLDQMMVFLDSIAFQLGDFRLSVLGVLKGLLIFVILFWVALVAVRQLERFIQGSSALTPSLKVLFVQIGRATAFLIAVLIAMNVIGIDLTALTVFGGALGLGLGFGLQKVVSNLASGVILLLDKSVKPGDVIALGETYGWINALNARYTSVITRDGIEHLIPNEELITQRVENWSHSHRLVRQKYPIGVSYGADIQKARKLAIEAASEFDRVLKDPGPRCLLREFGDSSVNLELRVWVTDPQNGLGNIRSDVLMRVWELYHEQGVQFPFPQRDVHLDAGEPIKVEVTNPSPGTDDRGQSG